MALKADCESKEAKINEYVKLVSQLQEEKSHEINLKYQFMIKVKNLEAEIENMGKENRKISQENKQNLNTID